MTIRGKRSRGSFRKKCIKSQLPCRHAQWPSEHQLRFADALGYLPEDLAELSMYSVSLLIMRKADKLTAFRAAHNGAKWCTGKQRALMKKWGVQEDGDLLTVQQAQVALDARKIDEHENSPMTPKQRLALETAGFKGPWPNNMKEAHLTLSALYRKNEPATEAQMKLLIKHHLVTMAEVKMTGSVSKQEASDRIQRLLDKERENKRRKTWATCSNPTLPNDSFGDPDPGSGTAPASKLASLLSSQT